MNIELYTKDNCAYCTRTKYLLADKNIAFREHKLNADFTREFIKERYPQATAYPVVIIDGYYIGGYEEIVPLVEEHTSDKQKFLTE